MDPELESPLAHRLNYYGEFFALFGDFDTYVRFFLLDDLVIPDRGGVRSLLTGEVVTDFPLPAYATTPRDYATFRDNSIKFVRARNERILRLGLRAQPTAIGSARLCREPHKPCGAPTPRLEARSSVASVLHRNHDRTQRRSELGVQL
ncbi:hypothetical protein GCM10011509_35040 [Ornithinimicrobium pekingense]|uniref:Uncharacterized protein n=1 Tax=Ornithinimicrobium pekingense TaxID=384677 RepID=A0ABQ2FCK2_9MICO|nr:hypothetical protein GCM10011509_35040 [Ornithinimicrobium pekingense]